MDAASFYRSVDAHLTQGDILERVPHVSPLNKIAPLE